MAAKIIFLMAQLLVQVMKKGRILLVIIFLVNACSSPQNSLFTISQEEKIWLERFFRHFMFYDAAIFTLVGSKPITSLHLFYYEKTRGELLEKYRSDYMRFDLNREDPNDMEFYHQMSPDEQKKAFLIRDKDFIFHFEELWDRWEKIHDRWTIKNKFLLIKKRRPDCLINRWKEQNPEGTAIYDVLFVNIPKTAFVIQENYELFKQVVGHDFDPLTLVLELKNEDSEFWNKITGTPAYSYLWGLLYGFGKENALYYYWKSRHMMGGAYEEEKLLGDAIVRQPAQLTISPEERDAYSISKFPIPAFVSFFEDDAVVKKYESERERIQKLYKGKDFVLFTLELLADPVLHENR